MKGSYNQNFQKGKGFGKGFKGSGKGKGGKGKGGGGLGSMQESEWGYLSGAWQEGQGPEECYSLKKRLTPMSVPRNIQRAPLRKIFEHKNMFDELGDAEELDSGMKNVFDENIRDKKPTVKKSEYSATPVIDKTIAKVNMFKTIEPERISTISADGEWEEIEFSVDSGATETVAPDSMPESIPTNPGPASRKGVEYEAANGATIANEGEKKFSAFTEDGREKKMVVQICDVNQGLLSVSKLNAAGNRVMFDDDNSYIQNKSSGEKTHMKRKEGMFTLKMWVRRPC